MVEEITRDQLRRMSPERRVEALRAMEAARKKRLEDEEKKLRKDVAKASEALEEVREEEEQELLEEELQSVSEEPIESLEERIAAEQIESEEESSQYKTGAEYNTGPGQDYTERPGGPDERLGQTNTAYDRERDTRAHREEREGLSTDYHGPDRAKRDDATSFLEKMYDR